MNKCTYKRMDNGKSSGIHGNNRTGQEERDWAQTTNTNAKTLNPIYLFYCSESCNLTNTFGHCVLTSAT